MVELGEIVLSRHTKVTSLTERPSVRQSCITLYEIDQHVLMFNAYL